MNLYGGIKNYIKNINAATLLSLYLPSPRFSPRGEAAFSQHYRKKTIASIRFALIASIFLYGGFGFLDPWVVPSVKHEVWLIRSVIVCLGILSLVASYLSKKFNIIQLLINITVTMGGIGIAVMMFIDMGLGGEIYYGGLLMILFGAYSFFKLQFKHAIICGGIVTLFYVISSLLDKKMNSILLINNYFFIIGANIMGMPVAYTLESYLRRSYQSSVLLKKAMRRVRKMSVFDELTNIANRRYFNLRFPEEFNRMRRLQYSLSLLIVDIDFFKEYNDQFGHQAGDECLVKIVGVLKQCVRRASDLLTRWGGEEFVIILGGTSFDSAYIIAEKIRQGVLDLCLPHTASSAHNAVTVSIGVSSLIPSASNSCETLFKAADIALYRAKESGRNRVEKESCS